MTKQVFEDSIIDLIDDTTGAGVELTDEGTIGVGVTVDETAVKREAGRLYDELTATLPDPLEPADPETPSPATEFDVTVDATNASSQLPYRGSVVVTIEGALPALPFIIDVEAWQDGKKIAQSFTSDQADSSAHSTTHYLDVLMVPVGIYQLKAFIFEAPENDSESWGKKLWGNEDAGTFTVEAAPAYQSDAPVTAGYARLPQQVDQYVGQYPELKAIADQPQGVWLGMEWTPDAEARGREIVAAAGDLPPLIVVYSIPNRDTGEYSQGGAKSPESYKAWIDALAKGIGNHPAIYILEPDALGHLDRMTEEQQAVRINLLMYAAYTLAKNRGSKVYIDASMWVSPVGMAQRIKAVETHIWSDLKEILAGFAINTSNYKKLSACKEYGDALSKLTGLPYLIDTSRNGIGTDLGDGRWCNVPGQAIGERPDLAKGYIWAKAAGESDGPENGGPNAGEFWVEGALALVRNQR